MRASALPPELRSATGHVMRPVARTMPGDVVSPVHNKAVYRHDTGRPGRENGPRTTLPDLLRGDVMSLVHTQAVCRHDTGPLTKTIVDLHRVMLDHCAGRLHPRVPK